MFKSRLECEKFFSQLGDYPLELAVSAGAAFYVDQNTRAIVIEQTQDTLYLRVADGPKNGFSGWTSKLHVSKVFPILPTRDVASPGTLLMYAV
ncbi:MAG: hypothetical protein HY562_00110 [Ignavibacteriales bacterium]|nr:hypothetical protein [Ignavibacteriales bacterium]